MPEQGDTSRFQTDVSLALAPRNVKGVATRKVVLEWQVLHTEPDINQQARQAIEMALLPKRLNQTENTVEVFSF